MMNKHLWVLLSAGLVLSLTGCEKEPSNNLGDPQEVRFSAGIENAPKTKTAYSGEGTGEAGNLSWERINWVEGDPLLIWSDYAYAKNQETTKRSAHYAVGKPEKVDKKTAPYPNQSWSIINDYVDMGLLFDDAHKDAYSFWSIYPAVAAIEEPAGGTGADANKVQFAIENAQQKHGDIVTKTEDGIQKDSLLPDMMKAVMLAAAEGIEYNGEVEFKYYPAFTAFEFTLSSLEGEMGLSKIALSSNSDLAGTVLATVKSETRTNTGVGNDIGASTYEYSSTSKEIVFTFPENTVISENHYLVFTVFALPQDIQRLKLSFYGEDLNTPISEGTLKYQGEDITFGACQKHCIRGIKIPSGWYFSYLTLDLKVLDWDGVDITGDSKDFPQATQMVPTGARNGYYDLKQGDDDHKDPYRQQWYFKDGETVTINMKVMLPAEGTWEFEPIGGTEANPTEFDSSLISIKNLSPEATDINALSGPINSSGSTEVKLEITYDGTAGSEYSFFFHTYVYDKSGNKFNIDSETQLYDRGRGYHTFFVNNALDK